MKTSLTNKPIALAKQYPLAVVKTVMLALLLTLMMIFAIKPAAAKGGGEVWGGNYFPNHELTAHTGEKLRFFDDVIKGKVVAINFIFTSCTDICPMETARLSTVFNLLGDRVGEDVFFYSITIDPANDTVEVLNDYTKKFGIDSKRWKFLTGDKAEIDQIREAFGLFSTPEEEADLSNHNINLMIGNQATGQWVRRSPFENSHVLANQLGSWLHGWKKVSEFTQRDYTKAPKLRQISAGETMFRDRCSSCHVINGGHKPVRTAKALGPDLYGVNQRRDPAWLNRWMAEPDKMLAEGDPIASSMYAQYEVIMPNFRLDEAEIEALLQYINSETERLRSRQINEEGKTANAEAHHHHHH